jgi:phosphoribosylanthranilate isomerase
VRVGVKICGVCRPEDAGVAAAAGADYIGVILAPGFGRSRTAEQAMAIYAAAPGLARVGLFVDQGPEAIRAAVERLGLDVVQLHGEETAESAAELADLGCQVWKAIRPRDGQEFVEAIGRYGAVVSALLLDGWSGQGVGGTGTRFPWDAIAAVRERLPAGIALVAAGGLGPENVADAVARLRPDVVDVSSGVERVRGEKDPEKVRAFVARARAAIASAPVAAAEGSSPRRSIQQ